MRDFRDEFIKHIFKIATIKMLFLKIYFSYTKPLFTIELH